MDWQPIETAPNNGTRILLCLSEGIETCDVIGWQPDRTIRMVIGWADDNYRDGVEWRCDLGEEGSADTEGRFSTFNVLIFPVFGSKHTYRSRSIGD